MVPIFRFSIQVLFLVTLLLTSKRSHYNRVANELLMLFRSRKKHSREISLYEPIGTDKEGNEISLLDVMEGPAVDVVEEYSTREDIRHVLDSMKSVLSSKEYEVICCRFGLFGQKEQTQREIARHLHISRSYVSRIEKTPCKNCGRFFLKTGKHALRVLPSMIICYCSFRDQ